ncbi:MAG: CYTH domain-containing protein [Erysipelotrichaceae bacterium]|nr:CYTH domain-containing protein [Erysipelotrichaceae bacterium]MDP3305735.1 CYTH domain-containing protein [Erysipelotrichaceae bacterium]
MKENLEIELKCLLNKNQFECLLGKMNFSVPKIQINTYYDTQNGDLQQRFWMCRIRQIVNKYEFTLKTPGDGGHNEFECSLEEHDIHDPVILDFFAKSNIHPPLYTLGNTTTHRRKFVDEYGEWCLDYNEFDGIFDYEIEYELFKYQPEAQQRFTEVLKSCKVEYTQAKTKFERMLNYKKDRE